MEIATLVAIFISGLLVSPIAGSFIYRVFHN